MTIARHVNHVFFFLFYFLAISIILPTDAVSSSRRTATATTTADVTIATIATGDFTTATSSVFANNNAAATAHVITIQDAQSVEADALCKFKCGITNWPTASYITGWGCTSCSSLPVTATNAPCGSGSLSTATSWTGVTCSGGGSSGHVSEMLLSSKNLAGTISSSLSDVTGLTTLQLNSNKFVGGIPTELSSLTNLVVLALQFNSLSSTIPSQLSSLTKLTSLYIDTNSLLSSSIPSQLSALTKLTNLNIYSNKLTGAVGSFNCSPSIGEGGQNVGSNLVSCIINSLQL
jgi:hypothetical protein